MAMSSTPKQEWLESFREKNTRIFEARPVKKSKYTSIARLDAMLTPGQGKPDVQIVSGSGAEVVSLKDALEKNAGEIRDALENEHSPKDQFEGFINSSFETSFVVMLGKGAHGKTIEISVDFKNNSVTKYFVIVEKGTETTLVERIKTSGRTLVSQTVLVGESSRIMHARIHNLGESTITCQQTVLGQDSAAENADFWSGGRLAKGKITNVLRGRGSSARQYEIVLSKEKDHLDLDYLAVHGNADTFSDCLYRAALRGESRNVFGGMILIEKTGERANAFLQCNSMILGEKASSNQIPGLEIKTDDVKATHSASVARVEEDEVFYLQSRGISRGAAERMVIESFLESVIFRAPETTRKHLGGELLAGL